jgi:hypothetical protein
MDDMVGQVKWNCWYVLQVNGKNWWWNKWHHLAWPHFAHSDKYVLTQDDNNVFFRHIPSEDRKKVRHGVVETSDKNHGKMIGPYNDTYEAMLTFVYVETMEPLSVYKCW